MVRPMTASPTEITVRVVGLGTKSVSAVVAIWQLITHCMNPEAPPPIYERLLDNDPTVLGVVGRALAVATPADQRQSAKP